MKRIAHWAPPVFLVFEDEKPNESDKKTAEQKNHKKHTIGIKTIAINFSWRPN